MTLSPDLNPDPNWNPFRNLAPAHTPTWKAHHTRTLTYPTLDPDTICATALQASSLSRLSRLRTLKLDFENHAGSPARVTLGGLPAMLRSLTISANNALMIAGLPATVPEQVGTQSRACRGLPLDTAWARVRSFRAILRPQKAGASQTWSGCQHAAACCALPQGPRS